MANTANATNMANVSLMEFLQHDPQPFRYYHRGQSDSTTTHEIYAIAEVRTILPWDQFSLGHIMAQFGTLLTTVRIASDALPGTPPPRFAAEDYLREIIAMYADRPVRRALASTFQHIATRCPNQWPGRTATTLGAGSSAVLVGTFVPDRAMYDLNADEPVNRLPGEIKPSWKWKHTWSNPNHPNTGHREEFKTRLSQLTFYMLQQGHRQPLHSGARYGYMLTDHELVAIRKENTTGTISMSQPVTWGRPSGNQPRLTVLLALWYLGMLASHDNDWNLGAQPGDPTDAQLIITRPRRRERVAATTTSSRQR